MVTHNYDQAEPYVTRKVRVHDGQIISDVPVNSREEESDSFKEPIPAPEHKAVTFKRQNQIAGLFARRNFQTQKARAALFIVFLLIISSVSFLFIGELFMHKDDYSTRQYSQDTFYREDDTRLVIKRKDGKRHCKGRQGSDFQTVRCSQSRYLRPGKRHQFLHG